MVVSWGKAIKEQALHPFECAASYKSGYEFFASVVSQNVVHNEGNWMVCFENNGWNAKKRTLQFLCFIAN